ncbi:hypothetical protein SRHO_G00160900 [Serrasalmus rhombeus]
MCAPLIPNLPRAGVVPVGPISFNEALVVVFAPPSLRYQQQPSTKYTDGVGEGNWSTGRLDWGMSTLCWLIKQRANEGRWSLASREVLNCPSQSIKCETTQS